MCQKELKVIKKDIQQVKKQDEKSVLLTEGFGLNINAIIVKQKMKNNNQNIIRVKGTFAIENVKSYLSKLYHFMNKIIIRELENKVNQNGFILQDIEKVTKREFLILRRNDTQDNIMPKEVIHWKNGKSLKENSIIDVLIVKLKSSLQKTILSLYHLREQTISQISNHYVGVVIVKNGRNFNIYENPELLKNK